MAKGKTNNRSNSSSNRSNTSNKQPSSPTKKTEKNTLLSNMVNYRETLQTYYRYNNQQTPQRDWMKYKFGMRIRDILDAKREIKILAVGTGSGEIDIDFLNEIVRCGKERLGDYGYSVLYQVVEPNASNIEFFRNTVSNNTKYSRINFKWFTGTFERFCDEFKSREYEPNKFDFVHFARCFYHIDSVKAFDYTYDHLLAKNGIMCGIGENDNSFWPKMMQFLANHKMEHDCFTVSGAVSQNYFLPGWLNLARARDWRYESYVQGYHFDVTPMFDPSSKDGNALLDFIMHAKSARQTIKRSTLDDFFKLLDNNKVEKIMIKDGMKTQQTYMPCELGAMMITKEH